MSFAVMRTALGAALLSIALTGCAGNKQVETETTTTGQDIGTGGTLSPVGDAPTGYGTGTPIYDAQPIGTQVLTEDGVLYQDDSAPLIYEDAGLYGQTTGSGVIYEDAQPYDSSLFDTTGSLDGGYQTYGDTAALGGYSFPGDTGQPSYFNAQVGSTVLFETDSATLSGDARERLQRQAAWLQIHQNIAMTIEGHADERGTREYNLALGARRANAVRSYLTSLGIDPARVRTVSFGKERPVALGSDARAWSQNRRAVTALRGGAGF